MTLLMTTIRNCIYFVAAITEEAIITKSGSKVFIVFIGIMKNVVKKLGKLGTASSDRRCFHQFQEETFSASKSTIP